MQFEKSSPELIEFFEQSVPDLPEIIHKKLFGYPACYINGNLFTSLYAKNMMVRLPEDKRKTLLEEPDTHMFEPMPGRPMREYVVLSQTILNDPKELRRWLDASIAYAKTLPPKVKK